MTTKSPVDLANDHVSIVSVLGRLGVCVPESSSGSSWKADCPFSDFYHRDRGRSKSLRVYYGTNSAFCFRGCGYLTPVSVYALKTGLTQAEAAMILLSHEGITLPTFDEVLVTVLEDDRSISKASLREALQVFCGSHAGDSWGISQFEETIIDGMDKCLKLLDYVQDEADAKKWLSKSKQHMLVLLDGVKYDKT